MSIVVSIVKKIKMKNLVLIISSLTLILISSSAFSQGKEVVQDTLHVSGICGMCEERIENAALIKGVKKVEWSNDTHELVVIYRADKVSMQEIAESIADAGHDSELITCTDEQYDKVHKCCKYRDDVDH